MEIPPEVLDAMKVDIALQCNPTNLIREVFTKWRKCQCSPYNWRTILDAISSRVVGERDLAYTVADVLRRENAGHSSHIKHKKSRSRIEEGEEEEK